MASLVETTISLVWLLLNHRLFLQKFKPHPEKYQSGLRRGLQRGGGRLAAALWVPEKLACCHMAPCSCLAAS